MNLFLKACGADGPLLLNVGGKDWVFPRPFLVIGRDPRADFVLDHPDVSRRHAYLQLIDGHLFCFDLGSRTGIQWDDGGTTRAGWLDQHRGIRIGPYSIGLSVVGSDAGDEGEMPVDRPNPLDTHFPDAPVLMETTLESRKGVVKRDGITVHRVSRVLSLVGRSPGCVPYLYDPSVSWLHCSLVRTPLGIWVVDLLGRGGIAINGVNVRFARLADGDELGVGYHLIRARLDNPAAFPARRDGMTARGTALSLPMGDPGPTTPGFPQPSWPSAGPHPSATSRVIAQASRPAPLSPFVERVSALAEQVPAEVGVSNASLMTVMNQFGQQQQQMLEQFLQSLLAMFQMTGSVHRGEQESIRRELGQLCKLTEDLGAVRAELSALRSSLHDRARPGAAPAAGPALQGDGTLVSPSGRDRDPVAKATAPAGARPPSVDPGRLAGVAGDRPADGPEAPQGDFYDWLSRRMETLQTEQQSRWQNLMNLVMGRQHGGATQ
jgi:pSer/pThr/pTyr-binding forkhead associated (FHA) protein